MSGPASTGKACAGCAVPPGLLAGRVMPPACLASYDGTNIKRRMVLSAMSEVLVNVTRGGMVESRHRGDLVVVDVSGKVIHSVGNPYTATYWRSAAKPFQAVSLVEEGGMEHFGFTEKELALLTSSHGGEKEHIEMVIGILKKIGLTEEALDCGAAAPMNAVAAKNLFINNQPFTAVHNTVPVNIPACYLYAY